MLRRSISAEALGVLLALFALQTLTYGITASLRNTDARQASYFFWVCLCAMLLGFWWSHRGGNGIRAATGITLLGVAGVWVLGARLAGPLLDLAWSLLNLLPQIVPAIELDLPIDTTAVSDAWLVIAEASAALSLRLQTWSMGWSGSVRVNDALVRNMIWMLILWLLSAGMGWFTAKRNAIAALLPSILLLAVITSYSERRVYTLWGMVLVLLLLMGLWNYKNHTVLWEGRRVDYSDSIRYDITQAVLFLTLVIGAFAFVTPSISWREIRDFFRERNENQIAETLGIQQQQVAAKESPVQKPTLPRDHLLTGGAALSQDLVMIVRTGELPPVANPMLAAEAPRYYWRSTTYDTYVGAGWVTSPAPAQRYEANTPLIPGLLNGYRTLHLDVELAQAEGKLFWSGILFSADVPIVGNWRLRPQSTLFVDQSTLLQADLFAALSRAQAYQAEAYLPVATIEDLRAASTNYPESIRERYLTLPRSIPPRVLQLAQEITEGRATAYDKAKAIESHLRSYPYDLDVAAPPEDQDVADYFLFELKKGYCDYYATAMVVLARANGLPARFVSGYAPGSYDAANAEYVVRELHAHSWAEIYFPEIGWIEFEPTAAQPEIILPPSQEDVIQSPPDTAASQLLTRFRLEQALYVTAPFGLLLLGAIFYFAVIERWRYARLAPGTAVERIYRRLYRLGRPLAGERSRAETAHEFRQKLIHNVNEVGARSRFANYLSSVTKDVELLTGLYQDTLFARSRIGRKDAMLALDTWKRLRLRLLLVRVIRSLHTRIRSLHRKQRVLSST